MSRLSVYVEVGFPSAKSQDLKQLLSKLTQTTRKKDPATLRYDSYVNEQSASARALEVYETPQAFEAHLANVGPIIAAAGHSDFKTQLQVLGSLPQETHALLHTSGAKFDSFELCCGSWKPQRCKHPFILMASARILSGQEESFRHVMQQLCDVVEAQDQHTLQYECFIDRQAQHCRILEVFTSERGYLEHVENCSSLLPAFSECIQDPKIEVLGHLSESTRQNMDSILSGHWDFCNGLEA